MTKLPTGKLVKVNVNSVDLWSHNERQEINEESLEELKRSIKEQGCLQPPIVRRLDDGTLQVIAGQRRTLAMRRIYKEDGIEEFLMSDIGRVDDQRALVISLVENLQREEVKPSEEAMTVAALRDSGLGTAEIALEVGSSEHKIRRMLRIASLHPQELQRLDSGELSPAQAEMVSQASTAKAQSQAANWFIKDKLSLEEVKARLLTRSKEMSFEHALFSQERYEQESPGNIKVDLFEEAVATDRPTFIRLQEETLEEQLKSGVHGEAERVLVAFSADLPPEHNLTEDPEGNVLVGLIHPQDAHIRVIRASEGLEHTKSTGPVDRKGALSKLKYAAAQSIMRQEGELQRRIARALLLIQLEGGERAITISRGASESGLEILDTAHPQRGMLGDLADLISSGGDINLERKLVELYTGSEQANELVLSIAGQQEIVLDEAMTNKLNATELQSLFPGTPPSTHAELSKLLVGRKIRLMSPLPSARKTISEVLERAEANQRQGEPEFQEIAALMTRGELARATDLITPELLASLSRSEAISQTASIVPEEELLNRYDELENDSSQAALDFRNAIDRDDMEEASKLYRNLQA